MYDPIGNSKQKTIDSVQFCDAEPPIHLSGIIHRFLDIKTEHPLPSEYRFHALPDVCTYAVFDQLNPNVTGMAKLSASSEEMNLGHMFHFTNIRFLPGVWQGGNENVKRGMVSDPYKGDMLLVELNKNLIGKSFEEKQAVLVRFVDQLLEQRVVIANPVTQSIFLQLENIHSVADMANAANLSARQLQRTLKRTTGFTPHDFLKVLRLQQSLLGEPSLSYADQSHFIHSFKKATGYTPSKFSKKFDV